MILEYWKDYNTYRFIANKYIIHNISFIANTTWIENTLIKHVNFHVPGKKVLLKNQKVIVFFLLLMLQKLLLREFKKTKNLFLKKL